MTKLHTVNALQRIVPEIRVWDYGVDFNNLWQMEGLGTAPAIVVWTDTPDDPEVRPVNTEPYLTPYDWALVACCQEPALGVTVVDLRPKEHDEADYGALRWLRTQRPECVPWLRRLTLNELVKVADADGLRSLLTTPPTVSDGTLTVKPRDALRGLTVSQVDLTHDASHHAIANLIGPLLLLRNPTAGGKSDGAAHREALRQVLVAAGLVPKPKAPASNEESVAGGGEVLDFTKLGDARLVLVDDQWHHGWAEWLSERLRLSWDRSKADVVRESAPNEPQCVAGNPDEGVSLWVSSSPVWVLERARKALDGKKRDARFKLRLTNGRNEADEILLLDLRLFPQGSPAETAFAGEIAALARRFTTGGAWPNFIKAELSTMQGHSSGSFTTDRSTMLTLLPRLLAHIDLSLPIVLFSSTGRRDIVSKLYGYGSIFTQFSKPLLFSEPAPDIAERAEKTLAAAIQSAQQFAVARKLCRRIIRTAEQGEIVNRRAPSELRHFELYLDESGSSSAADDPDAAEAEEHRFVIGGLLAGFSSALDGGPLELHRRMETRGLRWWPERHGDAYLLKRGHACDEDLPGGIARHPDETLGMFLDCLEGMRAIGVCLEYRDAAALQGSDELRSQWRSDNRHRLVLSTLLELLFFDVLPTITNKDSTISVFVATRARGANEFRGGEATVQRLQELYGYVGGRSHFQSLSEASILPIILEVLERRGGPLLSARLEHARGVRLSYQARPAWAPTRHQHYVADIVAHLCWRTGKAFPYKSNVSKIFVDGIYDVLDARLGALLRAARALETKDFSLALLELANCDFGPAFAKRSAAMILLQRILKIIEDDLSGEEFFSLARGIEAEATPQAQPTSPPAERGTVSRFLSDRGFGFINTKEVGDECFFHIRAWRSATYPSEGESVEFTRVRGNDGRVRASWVKALA